MSILPRQGLIVADCGTTNLRAFRLDADGRMVDGAAAAARGLWRLGRLLFEA